MSDRFTPKINQRGTKPYDFFELSMAQGPVGIGVTGENRLLDFIGTAWLLVMAEDRNLHLYRQTAVVGEWTEVTTLLPPVFDSPLPEGSRRVTFAFDQSARVIVAYELNEVVYLTRWDTAANGGAGGYVQNVTVAGVDPVVVFDATWAYDIPESDVLLFYLDAVTRSKLMVRVQRQLYATATELHDYGQAVVLDRVARLPLRYEALASDAVGDPLESGGGRVALISDVYPVPASDRMLVRGGFGSALRAEATRYEYDELNTLTIAGAFGGTLRAEGNIGTNTPNPEEFTIAGAFGTPVVVVSTQAERSPNPEEFTIAGAFGTPVTVRVMQVVVNPEDGPVDIGGSFGGVVRAQEV